MIKRGLLKTMLFLGVSVSVLASGVISHSVAVSAEQPQVSISNQVAHTDALRQSAAAAAFAENRASHLVVAVKPTTTTPVATTRTTMQATTTRQPATKQQVAAKPAVAKQAPRVTPVATKRESARTITMGGVAIRYIIGNRSMGAAPGNGAATWGGRTNYSNTSGQNTHFIGHNPGSFAVMTSLGIGSAIRVTDAQGAGRTYHVYQIAKVNPNGVTASKVDLWNQIVGTGGGQRITLQTCLGSYWREIVFAR
jgi:sortase (surface protein transpeptidase)